MLCVGLQQTLALSLWRTSHPEECETAGRMTSHTQMKPQLDWMTRDVLRSKCVFEKSARFRYCWAVEQWWVKLEMSDSDISSIIMKKKDCMTSGSSNISESCDSHAS